MYTSIVVCIKEKQAANMFCNLYLFKVTMYFGERTFTETKPIPKARVHSVEQISGGLSAVPFIVAGYSLHSVRDHIKVHFSLGMSFDSLRSNSIMRVLLCI